MKKTLLIIAGLILLNVSNLVAQNQIELPDVTTVVSGEDIVFEISETPDFEDLILLPEGSVPLVPELPQVEQNEPGDLLYVNSQSEVKSIFAEGQIGGGYPTAFIGDFSISRINGNNPFKLAFKHAAESGFSGNPLSAGFNTKDTCISLKNSHSGKRFTWSAGGVYEDSGNGLQGQQSGISSFNKQELSLFGMAALDLTKGFTFKSDINGIIYNRYADISDSTLTCDGWVKKLDVMTIIPAVSFDWEGYGFNARLSASYNLNSDLTGNAGGTILNRGKVLLGTGWKNNRISVAGDAGVVFGNHIGNNPVTVPFSVTFDSNFPVFFSNRNFSILLKGGISSVRPEIKDMEKNYKFSGFSFIPEEVSDWFGSANISLPIKTLFTINLMADYTKTAFGNGIWEPDYENGFNSGIYGYINKERQSLHTVAGLTYHYKLFTATGKLDSNWLDVPVLQIKQTIILNLSVQSMIDRWGAELETKLLFDGADRTPVINLNSFWQLTPAVKLVLKVDDFCKLVDRDSRIYAGNYISESGSVTMLVKFLF